MGKIEITVRGHFDDGSRERRALAWPYTSHGVRFGLVRNMSEHRWTSVELLTGLAVATADTRDQCEGQTAMVADRVAALVQRYWNDEARGISDRKLFSPCANEMTAREYEALRTGTYAAGKGGADDD